MIADAVSSSIVMFYDGCLGGRGFYWTSSNRGDKTWAINRVNELISVFSVSIVFYYFFFLSPLDTNVGAKHVLRSGTSAPGLPAQTDVHLFIGISTGC